MLGKCCFLPRTPSKTSPRASSTSLSGSLSSTATPSPSRCRRPANSSSKTSRSSFKAASGPIAALKLGSRNFLSGLVSVVLLKIQLQGAKEVKIHTYTAVFGLRNVLISSSTGIFTMLSLELIKSSNISLAPLTRRVEASPIYLKHYEAQIASRTLPSFELVILLPLQNCLVYVKNISYGFISL